ncbi:MAG TPA: R3H domain-containing nucleic acid-binding protein [Candidatus Acidoferrales bacterium]|nr:R3H domain-containing nucleic acid-binding protein [Candidatus Acidoferrales bacterium]
MGGPPRSDRPERPRPPARKQPCPPDLREPFVEARDFLAGLIAVLGLPARLGFGGVDAARDGRQITIDVHALDARGPGRFRERDRDHDDGLAILIGKHGATLDALSAVTNAAMHRGEQRDLFFTVDIEGYRARRVATLRSIATRCAIKVVNERVAVELEPMPPAERRIIHLALAEHRDVATESTGVGRDRRVVIMPRGSVLPQTDEDDEGFD